MNLVDPQLQFMVTENTTDFEPVYDFVGRHLVASYSGCNPERLKDTENLLKAMRKAVAAAGATILDTCEYSFPNGAITAVMLLSESHASIHTYPEHSACFVDLFTCGTTCDPRKFNGVMKRYLRPANTSAKVLERDSKVVEEIAHFVGR